MRTAAGCGGSVGRQVGTYGWYTCRILVGLFIPHPADGMARCVAWASQERESYSLPGKFKVDLDMASFGYGVFGLSLLPPLSATVRREIDLWGAFVRL